MSQSETIEEATRADRRARAAAELVLGTELLPGPVPLPDFVSLMGRRSRWRRRGLVLATVGSMAALTLVGFRLFREAAPISYVVDGTVAIADGIIDAAGAPGGSSASVRFSEGTEVGLAPGARLRVVGRTAEGAALALDRGRARFAVTHRAGARWTVSTGPFTVEVIGTRFTLDWSPRDERLVVDLTSGSVQVRGASVGGPVAMHPGERLIATASDRRVTLSPLVEAQAPPIPVEAQTESQFESQSEPQAEPQAEPEQRPELERRAAEPRQPPEARVPRFVPDDHRRQPGFVPPFGDGAPPAIPARTSRRSSRRADLALAAASRADWSRASRSPARSIAGPAAEPAASLRQEQEQEGEEPPTAPRVDPSPTPFVSQSVSSGLTLGGGGGACSRDAAQYRFERIEAGISLPDFYTLAFSSPRPDRTHSWCGQASLRVDASFNDVGRRNFFGRFAKETGQVVLKLHRSTDFTGKTVTVHFFVEGPADARFTAELVVVNRGRWVSGPPTGHLSPGRWWTISHTFEAENESGVPGSSNPGPFPVGGTSPVSSCDRLGLAIHSTGGRRVWTGAVYVDDVGWK